MLSNSSDGAVSVQSEITDQERFQVDVSPRTFAVSSEQQVLISSMIYGRRQRAQWVQLKTDRAKLGHSKDPTST
jgi:hypothetical protein